MRPFHPMESPLIIISEHQTLSEQKIFLLGNEIFVRATSKGIQFQPNLPDSRYTPRTAPRTAVSLDYKEFGQLLEFSNFLKSALRKRPAHTETLVNPLFANGPHTSLDVLSRYQTKFLLGKTICCKVCHLENESKIQFAEYMMCNPSSVVAGETIVYTVQILCRLNLKQFESLISFKQALKSFMEQGKSDGEFILLLTYFFLFSGVCMVSTPPTFLRSWESVGGAKIC